MCDLGIIVEKIKLGPKDILAFKVAHKLESEEFNCLVSSVENLKLPCEYMVIPYDIELTSISQ